MNSKLLPLEKKSDFKSSLKRVIKSHLTTTFNICKPQDDPLIHTEKPLVALKASRTLLLIALRGGAIFYFLFDFRTQRERANEGEDLYFRSTIFYTSCVHPSKSLSLLA